MHTKDSLIAQLSAMLPSDATVLMHSSCKSLGQMENGGDTILDALTEYFSRGLVVLPTHTWATVNDRQPVYDVLYTPVCIGLLPELFRKRPGVHRSWHPTHSVAAFGADAEEFVRGDENCPTPCARDSAWGRLYDRDAYVLLVGVELNRMTFFHGVEEWNGIPGRLKETPNRYVVIPPDGGRIVRDYYPHCGDSSQLYPKAETALLHAGAMRMESWATRRFACSPAANRPRSFPHCSKTIRFSSEKRATAEKSYRFG